MLEKTPASPLDSKEIKPVNLKGNQPWIFVGKTYVEAVVFWSSDENSRFTGKVPDAGKDWGQKEKRASEDEMAGWHHRCNGCDLGKLRKMLTDREAWRDAVHGDAKSQTRLGDWITAANILIDIFLRPRMNLYLKHQSSFPSWVTLSSDLLIFTFCNFEFSVFP